VPFTLTSDLDEIYRLHLFPSPNVTGKYFISKKMHVLTSKADNHEVTNSRVAVSLRDSALHRLPGGAAAVAAGAEARRLRRRAAECSLRCQRPQPQKRPPLLLGSPES